MSRQTAPKQFLSLYGGKSLIAHTIDRVLPISGPGRVLIVSGRSQLPELRAAGLGSYQSLCEPLPRNTAPAAAIAALRICAAEGDGVMAILPSDHYIRDPQAFRSALSTARKAAIDGAIVTLGIRPSCPETGYGYIETAARSARGVVKAVRFVEKPSLEVAKKYLCSGRFLWNAGIFVMRASTLLEEFRAHVPQAGPVLDRLAKEAFRGGKTDHRAVSRLFPLFPSVSLDYGIMEKSARVFTVPCEMGWSDLGNWRCLHELSEKDARGNAVRGDVLLSDCGGNLVHAASGLVAALGVDGLAIVETRDAVLVCPLERAQEITKITDRLKAEKRPQLREHLSVTRAWGVEAVLESGPGHLVRRLSVNPGAAMEREDCAALRGHLVVASGNALLKAGGRQVRLAAHDDFEAGGNRISRIWNAGRGRLDIIEIITARRGRK